MSPTLEAAIISLIGVFVSILGAAFMAGIRWAAAMARIAALEQADLAHATKDDVQAVRRDVAEIRGMFRLVLREDKRPGP